jgi:hypothetical protein
MHSLTNRHLVAGHIPRMYHRRMAPRKAAAAQRSTANDGRSYVATTFRLSKRALAEAATIAEALGLSTRTAAVQFSIGQLFRNLATMSARSPEEIRALMDEHLRNVGADD